MRRGERLRRDLRERIGDDHAPGFDVDAHVEAVAREVERGRKAAVLRRRLKEFSRGVLKDMNEEEKEK